MSRSRLSLVGSILKKLQENVRASSVTFQKSAYCRPVVLNQVYSNCRARHRALSSSPRPGKIRSASAATGRISKTASPSKAIARILDPDSMAIAGSVERAIAPTPARLRKSLRFNVVLTPALLDEHKCRKGSLASFVSRGAWDRNSLGRSTLVNFELHFDIDLNRDGLA